MVGNFIFSPDKTPQDLANLGITADNSSLQEKEYYKSIPEIQEAFKNESGGFDNAKFDKYYQEVLDLYNYVDSAKLESTTTDFIAMIHMITLLPALVKRGMLLQG